MVELIKYFILWWFLCGFISLMGDLIVRGIDCKAPVITILSGPLGLIKRLIV